MVREKDDDDGCCCCCCCGDGNGDEFAYDRSILRVGVRGRV